MKTYELIQDLLPMISSRVLSEVNNKLADYGSRGMGKSSFAFFDSISTAYTTLNKELDELFNKLNAVSINAGDISKLKSTLVEYIEEQYKIINIRSKELVGKELVNNLNSEDFCNKRMKESKALLEFQLKIINKKVRDKKKTVRWEIFKLIFSSILGATLTLIVKTFLER